MNKPSIPIAFLTAGAGGMYCGSCMHDNTLAAAISKAGHPVSLIPIYTPIRTDDRDVTVDQVFFGGINIYLQQRIPLFRRLPALLDRFLDHPWLIRKVTSRAIETDARLLGDLTISMLKGMEGNQSKEVRRLTQHLKVHVKPGIVLLSNILIGGGIPYWKQELRQPIAVILQGDDVFLDFLPERFQAPALEWIQRIAEHVDRFIVHSEFYGKHMAERLKLDPNKMIVAPLGINVKGYASEARHFSESPRSIGYLARLAPEKGLHHLVDAFIQLKQDEEFADVQLRIAGWLGDSHREYARKQFEKLRAAGLDQHYQHLGIVDREQKIKMLQQLSVLSVPTDFLEPKGLYALEALAAGTPLVLPEHGTFPELIRASQGGWLAKPKDPGDLSNALARVLRDPQQLLLASQAGRQYILEQRTADHAARHFVKILEEIRARHESS